MIKAKLSHLRISPRKVRLATGLIKGMRASEAELQLKHLTKRASAPVLKLLGSAIANAKHVYNLEKKDLVVKNVRVDPGPTLKRWLPRAMGRATPLMKRTCHITLILEPVAGVEMKKVEQEKLKPVKKDEPKETKGASLLEDISQAPERAEQSRPAGSSQAEAEAKKPYAATSKSKKKFFSRQTFGNAKKIFKRKSF